MTEPEQQENEPVLHHLICAYVGPLSDFVTGDHLVCPKCRRPLLKGAQDWEVLEVHAELPSPGDPPGFLARSSGSD